MLNLSAATVVFNEEDQVKLFNYGLGHLTDYGLLVSFPIFEPRSVAPEVLLQGLPLSGGSGRPTDSEIDEQELDSISHILPARKPPYSVSCSVWSLGILLLAKCIGMKSEQDFWPTLKVSQVLRKVMSLASCHDALWRIAREFNAEDQIKTLPEKMIGLLQLCLQPDPSQRLTPLKILHFLSIEVCAKSVRTI